MRCGGGARSDNPQKCDGIACEASLSIDQWCPPRTSVTVYRRLKDAKRALVGCGCQLETLLASCSTLITTCFVKTKKGVNMKMLITVLASFALLVGCGQSQEPASEMPAAPAEASAPANDVIVDYVWNTAAADMTDEQLADIVTRWNARIDAGGYDMMGANVLKPQFETDDYDFIWVLMWPSAEAREAGWADWNTNQIEGWAAELDGALSYQPENVYSFKPAAGRDSDVSNTPEGGTFIPSFDFCNFNEGHDQASLDAFRADYDAWLDESASSDYGYWIMEPQFELADADVVWLDLFTGEAAAQSGSESWNGSTLQAAWNAMLNCQNYTFAATAIRR
jgi:hypothetical protein